MSFRGAWWVGLTSGFLACGATPVAVRDGGGGTSSSGSGGSSGGGSTGAWGGSSGGGSTGATSATGSSSGGSTGSGVAILAGTLGFNANFEGEFNTHFRDGGPNDGTLFIFFSDYDFSPYCGPGDGGPIYLPNPVGARLAILAVVADAGPVEPGTYALSPDPSAVLVGAPGVAIEEGTANLPYDLGSSGTIALAATTSVAGAVLASGYFHASLVDPDGGPAGTLSGSFPMNPCPGAGYWQ